jgi:DNA repair exonuclease SbcCD ATPase subunit
MWSQREVIDYALQRRSTLESLRRPGRQLARADACDADPMLVRAAKHHGEPTEAPCPVCKAPELKLMHYTFGEQLGQYSGRIKRIAELEAENAALKTRVADLEAQLRTNSQNSSNPPSTDGPGACSTPAWLTGTPSARSSGS